VVTRILHLAAAILIAGALPVQGSAQQVTARAWVDSTSFLVGDYIAVHVDLTHPPGTQLQMLIGDTLSGFHVINRGTIAPSGDRASSVQVTVARYDSGRALLPPLPFRYRAGSDTAWATVSTNPLFLTVRTVAVDTAQEFRDIKPPVAIPMSLAEILLYAGIVLVLAAAVYAYLRYRRKKPAPGVPAYVPPPRPAHVIALEELGGLNDRHLWQQGEIKPYYSELTEIVRRYFENRFRFLALEQTTEEIMDSLSRHPEAGPVRRETEQVLRTADLVKFAKFQPGPAEHEEALRVAYDVVQKTAEPAGARTDVAA
jgi:hypothetical protein